MKKLVIPLAAVALALSTLVLIPQQARADTSIPQQTVTVSPPVPNGTTFVKMTPAIKAASKAYVKAWDENNPSDGKNPQIATTCIDGVCPNFVTQITYSGILVNLNHSNVGNHIARLVIDGVGAEATYLCGNGLPWYLVAACIALVWAIIIVLQTNLDSAWNEVSNEAAFWCNGIPYSWYGTAWTCPIGDKYSVGMPYPSIFGWIQPERDSGLDIFIGWPPGFADVPGEKG